MKKLLQKILFLIFGGGVALAAPIIPTPMQWVVSYETVKFDTADGDLGMNEYAVKANGGYYVRETPKNKGQFIATTSPDAIIGKKEVAVVCEKCQYYSEFAKKNGDIVRVSETSQKYNALRTVQSAPQPTKDELVNVLSRGEAQAAIAFDAVSSSSEVGTVTSFSWPHTTSGSDRLLTVGLGMELDTYTPGNTTITYNSVSLTNIRGESSGGSVRSELWQLVNPATGSNTVSVSSSDSFPWFQAMAGAISLTGVDQSTPVDANNGATGSSATPSVNVTTVADNAWVVDVASHYDIGPSFTSGAGQTDRWKDTSAFVGYGGSTEGPKTPAGSVTMSWSNDYSHSWAISAASFNPSGGAPPATPSATPQSIFWFD